MPGGSRNGLDHRTAQLFGQKLLVNFCLFLIDDIALVQCNHYRNPQFQKLCGKKQASAQIRSIHDINDHIRILILDVSAGNAFFRCERRHRISARQIYRDQFFCSIIIAFPDRTFFSFDRYTCPVPDTFIPAGECVVHGRLSTVRISCKSNPHNSPPFDALIICILFLLY